MKKRINYILSLVLVFVAACIHAQSPKAKAGTFALTNASIETVTKGIINNGTLIITDGKITAVGTNITVPQGAEVIDCKGQWIYPGMIDGGTSVGLFEMGQIPQATDATEAGQINPQMKALTAVN